MQKKKMLPIGIENFEEIISDGFYYVDKTGLIRELLNDLSKVTLFTRPRRFGKTLNMSMLRYFFEIGTDTSIFEDLKISEDKALCEEYMGKFPVISISLKGIEGVTFEDAREMFIHLMQEEVRRHIYLMNSEYLDIYDKKRLESLLDYDLSDTVVKNSLWILSQMLHKHYGKKVVILIDEYDVPLAKAYSNNYYSEMVGLICGIF
jgi:hypothetical protein